MCRGFTLNMSWSSLDPEHINGKLLGYRVLLYQGEMLYNNLTATKEGIMTTSLDECKNYTVKVAAFTSPGDGPYSSVHVTSTCPCGMCYFR
jgi:hypothetical protein